MAKSFQFNLVSPEESLMSEEVSMIVLPGMEGMAGILADHAPMIFELNIGILEVFQEGHLKERFFVDGGFADVLQDQCTILAESAIPLSQQDVKTLNATIERMDQVIKTSDTDTVIATAKRKMIAAQVMKAAIEHGSQVTQVV